MATIKNLLIRIGISDTNVAAGVGRVNRQLDQLAKRVDGIQKIGRIGAFSALAGSAIQLGRAFAPATAALGHFAVAAAPAAGAILALPAALAVVGAGVAVLKVGLSGMGDALKYSGTNAAKFDAAMKKLAPSARAFALTLVQTKNSFDPIRRAVQQKLFEGLAAQVRTLALRNLPILRTGMVGVAGSLNGLGREAIGAASTPLFSGMIAKVLATTAVVLRAFAPAVRPLITGLARLITIGLPLVRMFGLWVANGARVAATFLASDRAAAGMQRTVDHAAAVFNRNGKAAGAAHGAMDQLRIVWRQLSAIGKNLWSVIQSVAQAIGNSTAPSKSLLQLITDLTAKMAAWAKSSQGQQQLSQLFSSLQQVASNLIQILPQLGGVLSLILQLINGLPGPVRNTALQMLAWSIILSRFTGPIGGAIKLIGGLSKAAGTFGKIGMGVGKGGAALGKGLGAFGAAAGQTAGRFGAAAGNIARSLLTVSANVGRAAASALLSLGRLAVASAVTVARVVAGWVLMGVQSLIQAARMAAAWFIALGPVGWIIAAVIAIVVLIIANWSTVKKWTVAVWRAVWDFIKLCARGILAAVGWLAKIPGAVGGWFAGMARGAISGAKSLLNYIGGIPGAIGRAFSGAGKWLWNAGKNIIVGLWNGVLSVWNWLVGKFKSLTNLIPSWKGPPARDRALLTPAGVDIMRSLGAGITSQIPALKRTLAGVTGQIGVSPLALAGGMAAPVGGVAAGAGSGAVADVKTLAAAIGQALHGTTVQLDSQPVGQILSKTMGRQTDQRRRTG